MISAFINSIFNILRDGNAVSRSLSLLMNELKIEFTLLQTNFPNSIRGKLEWTKGTLTIYIYTNRKLNLKTT